MQLSLIADTQQAVEAAVRKAKDVCAEQNNKYNDKWKQDAHAWLTFDFFIGNERIKSAVNETLFYLTSAGRKGLLFIPFVHIQNHYK